MSSLVSHSPKSGPVSHTGLFLFYHGFTKKEYPGAKKVSSQQLMGFQLETFFRPFGVYILRI